MSLVDEMRKRFRPGSGNTQPISVTTQNTKANERRAPREGLSVPGQRQSNDSQAWPVALSSVMDPSGVEHTSPDSDLLDKPYEPDDPEVLRTLFRINT